MNFQILKLKKFTYCGHSNFAYPYVLLKTINLKKKRKFRLGSLVPSLYVPHRFEHCRLRTMYLRKKKFCGCNWVCGTRRARLTDLVTILCTDPIDKIRNILHADLQLFVVHIYVPIPIIYIYNNSVVR